MLVLGIDPGSRICGYGVLRLQVTRPTYVDSGVLRLRASELSERMYELYQRLQQLIHSSGAEGCAIEEVFIAKNPMSALKLGQARGAALAAMASRALPVTGYSARAVKKAVTGSGAASKEQVQAMMRQLLSLPKAPEPDAADALAVAWCHLQTLVFNSRLG